MGYYKDNDFEDCYINRYKRQITGLWEEKYKESQDQSISNQLINTSSPLANHMFKKRKLVNVDELNVYLNSSSANFDVDILAFWKVHESGYPNLSKMAKGYLSIPGSTVQVERIFSSGTDLISQRRCSLKPETIKMCMCLKNW